MYKGLKFLATTSGLESVGSDIENAICPAKMNRYCSFKCFKNEPEHRSVKKELTHIRFCMLGSACVREDTYPELGYNEMEWPVPFLALTRQFCH